MAIKQSIQMTYPRFPVSGPGIGGRSIKAERGEYTAATAGTVGVGDTIELFKLHPRFRVTGGYVKTTGMGTGVTISVGDAADPARYFAAGTAVATAGSNVTLAETGRDYINNASRYITVIATVAGATSNATGTLVVVLTGYIEEPA
ncbi:MAG TPA: hypothetical protein VF637_12695 [Sphingomicrobium sp.]